MNNKVEVMLKMKKIFLLLMINTFFSCISEKISIENVANFKGQQVTGVTVNDKGRVFANFPRWRAGIENSVIEVLDTGETISFPNKKWNSWKLETVISDSVFVAVQSVVALESTLYVLDTRNPLFKGVVDNPRIFVFDLNTNKLRQIYQLNQGSFHEDSYINDLRVDRKKNKIYLTDSGHAGLVIIDMNSGKSVRVLDNHESTLAEVHQLNFENGEWKNTVHSDGIALDTLNDILYYHALTGYNLYAISTENLLSDNVNDVEEGVQFIAKTSATDGMIMDAKSNLFFADLENNKIMKLNIISGETTVVAEGDKVKWADTFSINGDYLYYTNSRINDVKDDVTNMTFNIHKINMMEE